MSDLRDFTGKNKVFSGTDSELITNGSTGERVASGSSDKGKLRFNTTTNLMEYYDGNDWKPIDSPPSVTNFSIAGGSNVTSATIDNEAGGNVTIVINGSLFDTTSGQVNFIGQSETLSTLTLTRTSANQFSCTLAYSSFDVANSPYTIQVLNGSGLAGTLADAITADTDAPTFTNAADTTVSLFDSNRGAGIAASALCGASGASSGTFSVSAGSLPSGLSMSATDGAITGTANAVGSDTTSTFTVSCSSPEATATRQFKITIKAPTIQTFTSSTTFAVPSGLSSLNVLVVAGGGGGGSSTGFEVGGGGGAGGYIYTPGHPVSPGSNQTVTVGGGGTGTTNKGTGTEASEWPSGNGSNSVFGSITATGGGVGGGQYWQGSPGGSGGGEAGNANDGSGAGTGGQGNPGGQAYNSAASSTGAGGGGAGGAGTNGSSNQGGPGGPGTSNSISGSSVTYAGGGGGAKNISNTGSSGTGGPGGGGSGTPSTSANGNSGAANRGGGGGGAGGPTSYRGGNGGPGVVIISY
jgi:hypothetical protein